MITNVSSLLFALRVGLHVGALEPLDDVVAEQQGVGEGLEREGVLRTGDHVPVGLRPQGQDQLVVGQFTTFPCERQMDHAPVQVDALNGGLDEPGSAQRRRGSGKEQSAGPACPKRPRTAAAS